MKETTLCYLEKNGCYLMLHRTKKHQDENQGKWIGVGGKMEAGESPEECALREIREETGLTPEKLTLCSVITFISDQWEDERMYLFRGTGLTGDLICCDEGDLAWIPIDEVEKLPAWEGDRIFLRKMREKGNHFFSLKLVYEGETLREAVIWEDGYPEKLK